MRRVLGVVVLLVASLLGLSPATAAAHRAVTVYAHRGGAYYAPENTMGAFRQAWDRWGASGVWLEMDTQLTSDGQLVVMHDDSLDRTTTCTGTVISRTFASLDGCDASKSFPGWGAFEPVPNLRDVLLEGKAAWRLMIEIKDIPGEANFDAAGTAVAAKLGELVRTTGFPLERLLVQSFWPPALDAIKRELPGVGTVLLTSSSLPGGPSRVGIPVAANVIYSWLRGYTISAPASDSRDLTPRVVALGHTLGRQVVVYTPDTRADIRTAIATGVDGVISNRPDLVFAA
jgi:glycerophosphoryl diester phosphodiesterase